ncbi:DUF3800 domain-containing protein [Trueperella pyogenes]|uniref:DUF3800 domain-containing protein n=1 Tax=Trueperella pyogenes TaxID=1661 RepID=UPI00345CEE3D
MLVAYLDEIGETGAFVSKSHRRFNTSPAFGYGGFVISSDHVTSMSKLFSHNMRTLFKEEYENSVSSGDGFFEIKGAAVFHKGTLASPLAPAKFRVFDAMIEKLIRNFDGRLFYYADEKPIGTDKQTLKEQGALEKRESDAMRETLNRLARYAKTRSENIFIILDQINEKQRYLRAHRMYGHIYSRMHDFGEMASILEPLMHVDSKFSANMQFADWIAAFVSRAIEYQLIGDSEYGWVIDQERVRFPLRVERPFTYESKLRLWEKSCDDLNNIDVLRQERPLFPRYYGQYVDPDVAQKMLRIARASQRRQSGVEKD